MTKAKRAKIGRAQAAAEDIPQVFYRQSSLKNCRLNLSGIVGALQYIGLLKA